MKQFQMGTDKQMKKNILDKARYLGFTINILIIILLYLIIDFDIVNDRIWWKGYNRNDLIPFEYLKMITILFIIAFEISVFMSKDYKNDRALFFIGMILSIFLAVHKIAFSGLLYINELIFAIGLFLLPIIQIFGYLTKLYALTQLIELNQD